MTAVLHRNLRRPAPLIEHGEGAYLLDSSGKRYLDACGGAAVSGLGHSNGRVISAVKAQLDRLAYSHTSFFSTAPAEELAAVLRARAPEQFRDGAVMFVSSGSEAVEAAIKLARQYQVERGRDSKWMMISRKMAYHGNTLGALAVGGHMARRHPYEPLLMEVGRAPACYAYREQLPEETEESYGLRAAEALEAEILRLGAEKVAAFIAEPVSGATLGCVPPAQGYFARVREICDRHGVLLIADEVMCGAGRTGTYFALEQDGVVPDITVVAKGLGAGYQPIAAVLATGHVLDTLRQGSRSLWNGHTYMGHPVACAAALEVLKIVEEEQLLKRVVSQGQTLRGILDHRFGQHAHVGDIRGRGLFIGMEFVADRETKTPFPASHDLAAKLKARAMSRGLLVYPGSGCVDGVRGDHIVIAPPYIIEDAELEFIGATLSMALDEAIAEVPV